MEWERWGVGNGLGWGVVMAGSGVEWRQEEGRTGGGRDREWIGVGCRHGREWSGMEVRGGEDEGRTGGGRERAGGEEERRTRRRGEDRNEEGRKYRNEQEGRMDGCRQATKDESKLARGMKNRKKTHLYGYTKPIQRRVEEKRPKKTVTELSAASKREGCLDKNEATPGSRCARVLWGCACDERERKALSLLSDDEKRVERRQELGVVERRHLDDNSANVVEEQKILVCRYCVTNEASENMNGTRESGLEKEEGRESESGVEVGSRVFLRKSTSSKAQAKSGGGSSSGLGEFWNIELANSACTCARALASSALRSELRLRRAVPTLAVDSSFDKKESSDGSTTPSLRCFARAAGRRLGIVLALLGLGLALVVGKGKEAPPEEESGAVRGGSGRRERRGGVRGAVMWRSGRVRGGVVGPVADACAGAGAATVTGDGDEGREPPASVMSSQMGKVSRVDARWGLRRGMCERTGSERATGAAGASLGRPGMGICLLLVGAVARKGSGDGWRRRVEGAVWDELRCCCCCFFACWRPRVSGAGLGGVAASAGAGFGERDAAWAGRGLGDPLLGLGGLDKVNRPGVRVG
ncbi:hypothetical protein C8R44DRAFT_851687 [Mycena epipterygia]|nr:hypothetical protein C8R44DRAFT_851687 [Mycena epipterygia]